MEPSSGTPVHWPERCDGSGWLETEDEQGLVIQRACPGCPACETGEPESIDVIVVDPGVLRDLLMAYQALTGGPGKLSVNEAMGVILSYLPALLEMAHQLLEAQAEDEFKILHSAHPIFPSGQRISAR